MQSSEPKGHDAKNRLRQLFEYLVEYSRGKNPLRIHLNQYDWQVSFSNLPVHPSVTLGPSGEEDESFLRVGRPQLTPCPCLPQSLKEWAASGWDQFEQSEATCRPSVNTLLFEDSPERVSLWQEWTQQRALWRQAEAPARAAQELFNKLLALRCILDRDGEKFALTLGEGILRWKNTDGQPIEHPLLRRRCWLAFEAEKAEFSLHYDDSPAELLTSILEESQDADPSGFADLVQQARALDPLSAEARAFLARVATRLWKESPTISSDPCLLLTPRGGDFAAAAQSLLRHLDTFEIPPSLVQVVGLEPPGFDSSDPKNEPLLFTLPSNPEQERVAHRLSQFGSVLVQGPPGTGKSHTIANLIGHLLAQGKNILVTSPTSKALRGVRDKVAAEIQGLCVSVLDDKRSSQKQLESAVQSVANRVSQGQRGTRAETARLLIQERTVLEQLLSDREELLQAVHRSEYEDLVVAGQAIPPSLAARQLADWAGQHDWLPGPVASAANCPLNVQEFQELYRLQSEVCAEDESAILQGLPDTQHLPDLSTFSLRCEELKDLEAKGTDFGYRYWTVGTLDQPAIDEAVQSCQEVLGPLSNASPWMLECLQAGMVAQEAAPWKELLTMMEQTSARVLSLRAVVLERQPKVEPQGRSLEQQLTLCHEVLSKLKSHSKIGLWDRWTKGQWTQFMQASSVAGEPAQSVEDFEAILAGLELEQGRHQLQQRWNAQVLPLQGPPLCEDDPERTASEFAVTMRECLGWHETQWAPFELRIQRLGLSWERLLADVPGQVSSHPKILRLRQAISQPLRLTLEARRNLLLHRQTEQLNSAALTYLDSLSSDLGKQLRQAVQSLSPEAYREPWQRLMALLQISPKAAERQGLLDKVSQQALGWADALRSRRPLHQGPETPGPLAEAWDFRQWTEQIQLRHQTDLDALQQECSTLRRNLQELTTRCVDALTWKFQVERISTAQKQSLLGWLQIHHQIGLCKGTDKSIPLMRKALREETAECRTTVPVWIMPLHRVMETFRPGETMFDVVIVDEASQVDLTGLVALSLGREVVVVGDHQQARPAAVGEVFEFTDNHLPFDATGSLYDIVRRAFGEIIRLREHFRCVPEIIAFSNELFYDGDLQPMRGSNNILQPATLAHPVQAGQPSGKDINEKEAREVASLMASCIEQPEYTGKTFGVISLVGDSQALLIEKLLREFLDRRVLEARRILCSNPAQFQGDERDVIFLSMIDGPTHAQADRQLYNVAASSACDQMWVVHSLNPASDLKPDDLRWKLLKHAEQYAQVEAEVDRLKSPFEELILDCLVKAGYRVAPQLAIGSYRVDLMVIGNERRVALACDGDRLTPPENLLKELQCQQILERAAGLPFIRIRGSAFFLNPQAEMDRVFRRLEELGIEKLGQASLDSGLRDRVVGRARQISAQWWASQTAGPFAASAPLHRPLVDSPTQMLEALLNSKNTTQKMLQQIRDELAHRSSQLGH